MTNTTIANHGRRWQKWPPSAPHEALPSTPTHRMDGQQPPEQVDIILGGVEGVYVPPTLRCCGDASSLEQRSASRVIHTLNPPKNYIRKLGGLSPIHLTRLRGVQGLMWGAN
jgi:hypothetical protein